MFLFFVPYLDHLCKQTKTKRGRLRLFMGCKYGRICTTEAIQRLARPINYIILINKSMSEKFSIFAPTTAPAESVEQNINFKKSPNKFAVYEPFVKPRDPPKFLQKNTLTPPNLDNMKKIPSEYSALRQTLNFKRSNFETWMQKDEGQKQPKQNILRQTMDSKSIFRPKLDKQITQTESMTHSEHKPEAVFKPSTQTDLGSTRRPNYNPEAKSHRTIDYPQKIKQNQKNEPTLQELRQKWKSGAFKVDLKKEKSTDPFEALRKNNSFKTDSDEKPKSRNYRERAQSGNDLHPPEEPRAFRKKSSPQDIGECHTPQPFKSSYQERFKKVTSPTSTNNSQSRSPPNKFLDLEQTFKKPAVKLSIDDFEIIKTLGEGKFGVVTMAKHKKTKSLYALKKIPKQMIKSHFMVDQLALEIKLQSYLNHKNVLGIYGFFDNATHLFIVLEYMEGGTLYSQLKKNKILTQPKAAEIIKQITYAVQYLHDHDIAHRDIKPQNIVITNNVCKLCDFGWATICNERRKTYCGTFDYAAPEILEGKQYDWSVDLWCLGILTFQLLTGKAPFYHLSRKQTMKKIINCEMENVAFPETMSRDAVDFIERLIRKNPDDRMKASEALKHKFLAQIVE